MPKETLVASEETKEFFKELPVPRGVNGNEVNGKLYFEAFMNPTKSFNDLAILTETCRRMQDFYDTINSGRFFLSNAQRKSFPEIYSGETPAWANNWIKSQYVNSALHSYSASFDIYLQILWICFELYKQFPKQSPSILTEDDLVKILEVCNINRVESQNSIIGDQLCNRIKQFHNSNNTKEVRDLCKQIKHRQSISYVELSSGKHPLMVKSSTYNSHNTLSIHSLDDIIVKLKQFHKDLTDLSNYTIPIVKNHLEN